jgi:hypothetical protein
MTAPIFGDIVTARKQREVIPAQNGWARSAYLTIQRRRAWQQERLG